MTRPSRSADQEKRRGGPRQGFDDSDQSYRLHRLRDVAEICQVSLRTVQSWVASERLSVLRLSPRTVRVTQEALNAFLEGSEERGP